METTLYIIVSVVVFAFDIWPWYFHNKEDISKQRNDIWQYVPKWYRKLDSWTDKILFFGGIVNLIVCALLLLLKCFGVLSWW